MALFSSVLDMLSCASKQANVKDHFDQIGEKLQSLQKLLADSALFLPRYNLRMSQQVSHPLSVDDLENIIEVGKTL